MKICQPVNDNPRIPADQQFDDLEESVVAGFIPKVVLLPHQIIGRSWIRDRKDSSKHSFGGILADDMGLGKTIQMLSRVVENPSADRPEGEHYRGPTLIICPVSLLPQWASEIEQLTSLRVFKHLGTNAAADSAQFEEYDVVISTYDTAVSEYTAYSMHERSMAPECHPKAFVDVKFVLQTETSSSSRRCTLYQLKWWRVILDESHLINNSKTKRAIACFAFEAKYRWCLSGTPMQNNVVDLFSLFKFIRIPSFSHWGTFSRLITKPISSGQDSSQAIDRLQVILKQVMLRRLKSHTWQGKLLVELPKRKVIVVSCVFEPDEQEFYHLLESTLTRSVGKLVSSADKRRKSPVPLLLLRLRQACNYPFLAFKVRKSNLNKNVNADSVDGLSDDLHRMALANRCALCTSELILNDSDIHCRKCTPLVEKAKLLREKSSSAKLRQVLCLIREINQRPAQEKIIVFSQFPDMLLLIGSQLSAENIQHVHYNGSMSAKNREASLETIRTNSNTQVILISLIAGCSGLNLVSCNNVILVDPCWNPALEDQAIDRVHRLGQKRDVNIYKLKVDGTVEDRIMTLQEQKRTLISATLCGEKVEGVRTEADDIYALFQHHAM